MGRAIAVVLENHTFRTKGLARKFFQEMLGRYVPGDVVNNEDAAYLVNLLKRHPGYFTKLGEGVHHFEVMGADFASQCFAVHRTDGSFEDFSLHTCVDER